jgi:hypothetical protein
LELNTLSILSVPKDESIKIFTIECNIPIKPKNHSSFDICLYDVSPHFGVRNSSLNVCLGLLMHAVYIDGQHKRTADIEVPDSQEARQAATHNSCGLQGCQKNKLELFSLNYVQPYDKR